MPVKSLPVKKATKAAKKSVKTATKLSKKRSAVVAESKTKNAAKKKPAKQKIVTAGVGVAAKLKKKASLKTKVKEDSNSRRKSTPRTNPKPKTKPKSKRLPRCKLSASEIEGLFARFAADTPEPKGELNYSNPYTLVVAVALSAQATDVGVNKATDKLFKLADTPKKMLALGEDKVRELVKTIGLYKTKAKNVIALSQKLIDEFGAQVPQTREALESLPGVGRKTANVVLNIAFGQPTIAVDTHLFRVGNRTGLAPGKDPLQVEQGLLKSIPEHYLLHAHHWLILHGRYICLARKPRCSLCIIKEFCKFKDKTDQA